MSILTLLTILILAGVLAWIIRIAPIIDEPYKRIALWVLLVVVVLYLVWAFLGPFPDVRLPTRKG